ncbi:MAG: sigma-70 family RNA polymerase sigma factor [Clostridia bacterium]|nr:sigma-70 family RNA polymerase sigma factor [Clostridia bacterium]
MEDIEIVSLYLKRNESAIRETADKYGNYCYSIAYNILSDEEDSKECVNDTYMGAWNSIPPNNPTSLSAYIGRICRNISLKKWRANSTQKRGGGEVSLVLDELSECISSGLTLDDELENTAIAEYINSFLSGLSPIERRVFVKRYWYLSSVSAISSDTGFSQSKIKSILHRLRKRLRSNLEKEGVSIEI